MLVSVSTVWPKEPFTQDVQVGHTFSLIRDKFQAVWLYRINSRKSFKQQKNLVKSKNWDAEGRVHYTFSKFVKEVQ